MFSKDIGVNRTGGNAEMLSQEGSEAGGVENGATADDLFRGQPGEFQRHMGHDIHRVGCHQQDGVLGIPKNLSDYPGENGGIALEELQSSLSRTLSHPATKDDHISPLQERVVSSDHAYRPRKWGCVQNILCVSLSHLGVDIDQHQFAHQPLQHERIRSRAAHKSASDNSSFQGLPFRIPIV